MLAGDCINGVDGFRDPSQIGKQSLCLAWQFGLLLARAL